MVKVKHSHIQRSILERHNAIVSRIRPDFISILLSEREVRSISMKTVNTFLHMFLPQGLARFKEGQSVSNPLTFHLFQCFGTDLFESAKKALWVYFEFIKISISFEQRSSICLKKFDQNLKKSKIASNFRTKDA